MGKYGFSADDEGELLPLAPPRQDIPDRPKTSRHVPNPTPDEYADYVLPSPNKSHQAQGGVAEEFLELEIDEDDRVDPEVLDDGQDHIFLSPKQYKRYRNVASIDEVGQKKNDQPAIRQEEIGRLLLQMALFF
uniref:Uncharacterized protein n=1 Tax=Heterosigma akashiwo TaxID=2829 RepID=A0A6S9H3I0_HETAK|mmetsp:Transcript_17560/g.24149  ORF Transcript_17560/g.24149 Transcript_17560/m.24149 type:complete len:133 (+) Transcript_17560:89-487(+)|eukprot:CAMPEP_0194581712 /NCGR_PEP_ID=MMETSP0292-20121207/15098_1 /TAXON_ID=39354 /ORGANISM="Heterosigma akashiwo, Strain CCMP2393" /LENGTH=132 /DNA_ID=CAMNT_0039435577 /DNA_START=78 /DNA_END=476 /DNA_ORIENTATION=+